MLAAASTPPETFLPVFVERDARPSPGVGEADAWAVHEIGKLPIHFRSRESAVAWVALWADTWTMYDSQEEAQDPHARVNIYPVTIYR